ncbi:MAG: hypothetical protein SFY66_04465 [Oculatellaceae cyanobacterium bins.114]|nr:hypothetical protein [Oculatellaceae cyanobacterium bins.114]
MTSFNQISRSVAIACFVVGTIPWVAQAQSTETWTDQVIGSYQSRIWSGSSVIPSTTEFIRSTDGSVRGRYTMVEADGSVPGLLLNCQTVETETLRCDWQDKYGTGTFEASFSGDFSRFNGYWGTGDEEPWLRWSGLRSGHP